jgi:glycosyltransferase involved in cell wall biosynthesis
MHRSGTSLTTGILNALGVALSEDLMPPTQDNAKGYFESVSIANIHDQILRVLGSAWNASTSEKPFPDQWWTLPAVQPFKAQLKDLVRREVASVPGIWGFKDPRTARLLPLWNGIIEELGLDARFVLVARHPRDVAKSLLKRDGMDGTLAEQLWLEHTVDALTHGKKRLRAIVEYTRWFDDPIGEAKYMISSLGLPMPADDKLREVIASLVSDELRHNKTEQPACLLPFSRELYEALTARDAQKIDMLAQLFEVSRTYTYKVIAQEKRRDHDTETPAAKAQISLQEMQRRVDWKEDVDEEEIRAHLQSSNAAVRRLAHLSLVKTLMRRGLEHAGSAAALEDYQQQSTLDFISALATLSDVDVPLIEMLKQVGIRAIAAGKIDEGFKWLEEACVRAVITGQCRDPRSRRAFKYAHDAEIDKTLEHVAARFTPPAFAQRAPGARRRMIVVCSKIVDQDAPSLVTVERAKGFRDLGFDVRVLSTGFGGTHGKESRTAAKFARLGIPWINAPKAKPTEQVASIVAYMNENPADVAVFMPSSIDLVAKLLGCVGIAPVQSWDNRALEPLAGKYDLINQSLSPEQEQHTAWPGRSRYTGAYVAMGDEIDAALPLPRQAFGVPDDAIVLATFGRIEKCANLEYLEPVTAVLAGEPQAWLVFAGPDDRGQWPMLEAHFKRTGVISRVRYLGNRQSDGPSLLKSIDIYCDSYPWPGGQSLLDAMEAGVAIAAMRRAPDRDLDPTGHNPTSAVAEVLLNGVVPLADAGDAKGFTELIRRYVADPQLRAQAGSALRRKAVTECSMAESNRRYGELLAALVDEKSGAASSVQQAVS